MRSKPLTLIIAANAGKGADLVLIPHRRVTRDADMGCNLAAVAKTDSSSDDRIGTNLRPCSNLGTILDDGRRMYEGLACHGGLAYLAHPAFARSTT